MCAAWGAVLERRPDVFASLYNDRAIAYRVHQVRSSRLVALSAGIQRMVRSDLAASGVMFTLDTESGFRDVVFITASWGLGETVVQGAVNPDEFYVFKPTLAAGRPAVPCAQPRPQGDQDGVRPTPVPAASTAVVPAADRRRFCLGDAQVEELARYALTIEQHYRRPMDIEWALDGEDGKIYILQARPETVKSRRPAAERYSLKERGAVLATGRAIGQASVPGRARSSSASTRWPRCNPATYWLPT